MDLEGGCPEDRNLGPTKASFNLNHIPDNALTFAHLNVDVRTLNLFCR
jgi:hypothetical protein